MTLDTIIGAVLRFVGVQGDVALAAATRGVRALLAGFVVALLDGAVQWLQGTPGFEWRIVLAGALIGILTGISKALRDGKGWELGV